MKVKSLILLPLLITLTACGATAARYQPIVDQPNAYYTTDLADCQQLAETRSYSNDDVKTAALTGAVAGALFGAIEENDWENALGGAVIGGLVGGGSEAWSMRGERKQIVIECLRGRHHRIAG